MATIGSFATALTLGVAALFVASASPAMAQGSCETPYHPWYDTELKFTNCAGYPETGENDSWIWIWNGGRNFEKVQVKYQYRYRDPAGWYGCRYEWTPWAYRGTDKVEYVNDRGDEWITKLQIIGKTVNPDGSSTTQTSQWYSAGAGWDDDGVCPP